MLRAMPTSEFSKQIGEILEICRTSDDPIILTHQGHGDLVVMGVEAYNKLLAKLQLLCDVAEANARLVEDEILTDEEVIDQAMQAVHEELQSRVRLGNAA